MISIDDIYNKEVNFLFGAAASFGLLPTLQLQLPSVSETRVTRSKSPGSNRRQLKILSPHRPS